MAGTIPTAPDSEKYHRPVTSRFEPSEWEKQAVRVPWMACDRIAMFTVEGQYYGVGEPSVDRNGYPTS